MPQLVKSAIAGSLESGDALISVAPNPGKGIDIQMDSIVKVPFGDSILATARAVLKEFGIQDAIVGINDKGAVDCAIRARMQMAICRAMETPYDWSREDGENAHACPANRLKRTLLFVSGSNPSHMLKARFFNQDCLIYDLEDSVPLTEKDVARSMVYHMVRNHRPKDKLVAIRVNAISTVFFDDDLEASVRARPDAIRLPKVESAEDVRTTSAKMAAIEKNTGIEVGNIRLWCNLESHLGILRAKEIAMADSRVEALAISAEDYTADMNAQRTKAGWEIFHARNMVLLACREAGIDALDAVFADFNDLEGLKADMEICKTLGFDGKTAIHPRQVDIINAYFTPNQKEIDYALRVFGAIEEAKRLNKGAIALDGAMVDEPIVRRARTILAKAKAAGIKVEGDDYDR